MVKIQTHWQPVKEEARVCGYSLLISIDKNGNKFAFTLTEAEVGALIQRLQDSIELPIFARVIC